MAKEEFLHFENEKYIYDQFEKYQRDKSSVPTEWVRFFQGMELGSSVSASVSGSGGGFDANRLIDFFQMKGHLYAKTSSLKEEKSFDKNKLLNSLGISSTDLATKVSIESLGISSITVSDLIDLLEKKYCNGMGVEFFASEYKDREIFLHKEILSEEAPSKEELVNALKEVGRAKILEDFLQKKFLGAKRFSVEGGESVLSLLHVIVDEAAKAGYKEGYIGMAHRGRVNTLCHLMEKPYDEIFAEFKADRFPLTPGLGDVKYHNGYEKVIRTQCGKEMFLQMAANPSHLEAVDALIPGMIRARLDEGLDRALGIVVHGDAAVAGQGIVYETLQFTKLEGYSNGGNIHVVIDNHIGFTTYPKDSRSTLYPTDIAKAFSTPVLHVDAANIEAVILAAKLAVKYKETFHSDIFIHYNCHRLYGHNEADEPFFTNPSLYKKIRGGVDLYSDLKERFTAKGVITTGELETFEKGIKRTLSSSFETLCAGGEAPLEELLSFDAKEEDGEFSFSNVSTTITSDTYERVKNAISVPPEGMTLHPKIAKLLDGRRKMLENQEDQILDWGCAELMAYGALLAEGKTVRLSGQDSRRGTFSHRHSVYVNQENDEEVHFPLDDIAKGAFTVYNSPLSEYGVMGFEYGYSLKSEKGLVIWEAQFGDFYNGATIIIDQYISSTRSKWGLDSSLVLYLPHGMEGMGSEHSSARIERFLQLAGRKNMRIYYPTTAAQIFHLIRAQAICEDKIPLVVFTPKSMLRAGSSKASELLEGKLEPVLTRGNGSEERVVFCSGKIGDEIAKADRKGKCAIIKIEQLYPFPQKEVEEAVAKFPSAKTFIYAQEEAQNQGAYSFARDYIAQIIEGKGSLQYVGRKRLESTATGFSSVFKYNQQRIIRKVVEG